MGVKEEGYVHSIAVTLAQNCIEFISLYPTLSRPSHRRDPRPFFLLRPWSQPPCELVHQPSMDDQRHVLQAVGDVREARHRPAVPVQPIGRARMPVARRARGPTKEYRATSDLA